MTTTVTPRTSGQRIAEHHAATAALHRSFAATVGLEDVAASHEEAAERFDALAAKFRSA
jgi:hypothetical protein